MWLKARCRSFLKNRKGEDEAGKKSDAAARLTWTKIKTGNRSARDKGVSGGEAWD